MNMVHVSSNRCDAVTYTTPEIIAKAAQIDIAVVEGYIQNIYWELCELTSHSNSRHSENNSRNRLNKAQAELLLAHMEKDGSYTSLRDELIRQFDTIIGSLKARKAQRKLFYAARLERIDAMRDLEIASCYHGKYSDLALFMGLGESTRCTRYKYAVPAGKQTVDYLSVQELTALTEAQKDMTKLLCNGYDYEKIRNEVMKRFVEAEEKRATSAKDVPSVEDGAVFWKYVADNVRPFLAPSA